MGSSKTVLLFVFASVYVFSCVSCSEFVVGGEDGWVVPTSTKDLYNQWASKNRFKVYDTIRFKYKKDSVLVVTEEEYKNCRSSKPEFFSNKGDTVFNLDRSGLFYFISGVSGHCQKGQKMIIKVLDVESPHQSPPPSPMTSVSTKSLAVKSVQFRYTSLVAVAVLVISIFALV
ncbi:PREDICTED: early nodulin-like protein 1 [Tarenaya hassleriana]|uniref:early nodulin-like protein 1 n=1 Tax=Tarenaya hassleriana TaxID=28532 RepID=UPI00053C744E|nr:PREDICTED: early nodulin-like protein 1 [Tarenaya hassleriana]